MPSLLDSIQGTLDTPGRCPGGEGRGIVIVGGGSYLPSAYIAIRHLRAHGCTLPVQLWHLGKDEVPQFFAELAESCQVQMVDAFDARGAGDFRTLGGWECKIHAIIACPFEQVLLIDADNIPLFDPSLVFDSDQLRQYGQIFWPDFHYPPDHQFAIRPRAWKELNLPARAGLEIESGQIVVDRSKCWRELQIVRALNLDSVHCHRQLTWGDKDTFTLAWLLSGRPCCTVPQRPRHLRPQVSSILWQHWFDGRRLFQHQRKWIHPPDRARSELLEEELLKDESLKYLREFWQAANNRQSWGMKPVVKAVQERTVAPSMAEVLQLAREGKLSEADAACRQLLKTKPADAQAWHTLGLLARDLRSFSEAAQALARAVELAPDIVQYLIDLAMAFCNLNRAADAIPHLIHALRLNVSTAKVHSTFGFVLEQMGRVQEAVGAYRNALLLKPTSVGAHLRLAKALRGASDPAESIRVLQKSLQLRAGSATAYEGIAAAAEDLGDWEHSISALRTAVKLRPQSPGLRSWLLYNLHYDPQMEPAQLFDEHREWDRLFGPYSESLQDREIRDDHNDRLRIGYVSPDFRYHTVPHFIGAALKHHDRRRFEIFCYSDVTQEDETTARIRGQVERWRDIVGLDDQRVRQILQDDQIDILVDLRGHAAGNRMTLFSARAAPVQVNMVGYFDTTGLSAMDYRLTDQHQDPPGLSEQYHSEQLLRLGRSCWCYMADEDGPPVEPLPGRGNGYITFGSLNKLLKISELCARLWAAVLDAVPGSKLLLSVGSAAAAESIQAKLRKAGIAGQRIKLVEKTHGRREYLQRFGHIDIALDTFPFNGITTSCDGLWMGVPVVSLSGQTSVSRAGTSILHAVGLPQLAVASEDAFVSVAAELAQHTAALEQLRLGMRERMLASPLMDHVGFTRDLEGAYVNIWNDRL